MAFLNPSIMGGDYQVDVESEILSICKVSYDDYFDNDRRVSASILERNLEFIITHIRNHVSHLAYHVLGFFIIRSGAKVPESLKEEIASFAKWTIDKKVDWGDEWIEPRKFYLKDFRSKLRSHKAGAINYLVDLKLSRFPDFGIISIGLEQLERNFRAKNFHIIKYINLDTCNLLEFPDQILSFTNLRTLSLEHNMLKEVPDSINRLKNLTALYLNGNNLNNIPDSIGDLKNLERLGLQYNNLKTLPRSIQDLTRLKSIFLRKNRISEIPDSLKKLKGTYIRI